jgi:hypothetical protein
MSAPPQQATLTPADKARLGLVQALRGDNKGAGPRPLAETVQANLDHVWEHGGRKGDMTAGLRPDCPRRPVRPGTAQAHPVPRPAAQAGAAVVVRCTVSPRARAVGAQCAAHHGSRGRPVPAVATARPR